MTGRPGKTEIQVSVEAPISMPPVRQVSSAENLIQRSVSGIVPYVSYGAQRIGALGVIGLSLCVFSVITFLSGNAPLREQIQSQAEELTSARAEATLRQLPGVDRSPKQQATRFVDSLPTRVDMPQVMASIVAAAASSRIELLSGNYEYIAPESGSIARYRVSLPIKGSYPQVRQFIESTLVAVPSIALDSMRVERNSVSDQVVAANLQFSIMVGAGL